MEYILRLIAKITDRADYVKLLLMVKSLTELSIR